MMTSIRKILLFGAIVCFGMGIARAADVQWTVAGGPNPIPIDGNTYFISDTQTLSAGDLIIAGILEIRDGGTLKINSGRTATNNGTVTLNAGGALLHSGLSSSYGTYDDTGGSTTYGGTGMTLPWTATQTTAGFIPNDGATYYLNSTANINSDFNIFGPLEFRNGATINATSAGSAISIINYDSITMLTGSSININDSANGTYFENYSSITMNGGTMNFSGSKAYFYQDDTGDTFVMNDGSINFNSSAGYFNIVGGSFTMNGGTFDVRDNFLANTADAGNVSLNVNGGTFTLHNGASIQNGNSATYTGSFIVQGGTFVWDGEFKNAGDGSSKGHLEISNNATFVIGENASLSKSGTNTYDVFGMTDFTVSGGSTTIPSGQTLTVPQAAAYNVGPGSILINLSSTSIDVDGDMYVYGTLTNGGATAGTVNVNYGGRLLVPGGTINSGHASSAVNVYPGGSLYNYHGTVDEYSAPGQTITLSPGSKFINIRGNNPGSITKNTGSIFLEEGEINLDTDLELDQTWTITNKTTINGYGNMITFGELGKIRLYGPNAALRLEDVIIKDISGSQILLTDDTTTLSINNVTWMQDANYSFTKGTFYVDGNWDIKGDGTTFEYSSNQVSNLKKNGVITLDHGTTFNYNSGTATNIAMEDSSSGLHFIGSTLNAEQLLRLQKGTLTFDDTVYFTRATDKAIVFGDGATANNNLSLDFRKFSELVMEDSGTVSNQNV